MAVIITCAALLVILIGLRLARPFPLGNVSHCRHHRVWLDDLVH